MISLQIQCIDEAVKCYIFVIYLCFVLLGVIPFKYNTSLFGSNTNHVESMWVRKTFTLSDIGAIDNKKKNTFVYTFILENMVDFENYL